jgi:hypothetical protein
MPKAKNRSEIGVARAQRRGRAQGASAAAPIHTEPPGSKDTRPRKGTIRAVIEDLIEHGDGHQKMVTAFDRGIQASPAVAVKYLELGARVLDKTEDTGGKHVHFHLYTNVNFEKLRGAQQAAGLPPLAERNGADG